MAHLPGDFNHDGTIDAADYVVWRRNPGGIYTPDDYTDWRANFGQPGTGSGAIGSDSAAVPEPNATGSAVIALLVAFTQARRTRRICRSD